MVSILYPGMPQGPDFSGFTDGLAGLGQMLDNRRANKAYAQYDDWLRGISEPQQAQQQPMSLASLGQQSGQIERQPLAPPTDPASQRVAQAHAASGGTPPQGAIEAYIRHAAKQRGIDPEIAVRVAMSEGGVSDPTRQSDVVKNGVREQSYGPFQLYMGGGLGNEFQQATGLHPSDPGAWQKGIDFALDKAKEGGWGPWYGAAKAGIGDRDGIGGAPAALNAMSGQSGQQMPQGAPQGNAGSLLPPADVMKALFKSEQTRPLAIQLAQSAIAARQGDPEAALKLEKMRLEVENLRNPQQKPTSSMQEYEFARSQGFQGTFQDYELANKRAGATNVSVGMGEPGDGELRKSLDKAEGDQWSTYKATGATSGAAQQDFAILDELIKIAPQGPITGRLAEAFPGVSSAGDAFQSIVKRIAPTLRAPGSGSTSDIEYDGMLRSLPALRNTPEANVMINQIMKEKAALNVQRGEIITQYQTNQISAADARRALAELDRVSIITPEMKSALGIVGSGGKSKPISQQEYDALPSGAEFTAPDGSRRRKP